MRFLILFYFTTQMAFLWNVSTVVIFNPHIHCDETFLFR